MADIAESNRVTLGAQGRLVIPAVLRKALHLNQGDRLVARQVGESLVIEQHDAVEQRLWDMYAEIPQAFSLVDELIQQRRKDARNENKGRAKE